MRRVYQQCRRAPRYGAGGGRIERPVLWWSGLAPLGGVTLPVKRIVFAILVLATAVAPAAAQAATRTVTVTGDRVISSEIDPANTHNCSTIVFYEWTDVPGTTSATVTYTVNGEQRSETKAPPFDDSLPKEKPPRTAPPGRHRITVGWSYGSGPSQPNEGCRQNHVPKYEQWYSPTGTVTLTVEGDSAACTSARKTLTKQTKTVRGIQQKLQKASKQQVKRVLRGKLAKAKQKRASAGRAVTKHC